jgi:peptidyl-prolyl cis-trans isomerase C
MTKAKNNANNNVIIILAATAVILIAAVSYNMFRDDTSSLYKNSPVVGKVDGKPVYQIEADEIVAAVIPASNGKKVSFTDLDENSKNMIIREVAAQRAMLKEAANKGIKEDDEIKRKVYEYKNKLIRDQVLAKFANAEITPEKLTEKYAEVEKSVKGKTQIKVSHILLDSEDSARKAEELLKKEPFAKVAKEMSVDSSSKDKGGDIGYLLSGTMDPDFEKAALALKQGEVSGPVKTKFGWHIIKLDEKKLATVAPFEALKGRIAQEIYTDSLKKYADSLLTNAKIELVATDVAKSDKKDEKLEDVKPAAGKEEKKPAAKPEAKAEPKK